MSDLLNQASLVMVPSGYKEDTVYSVVPSDGSGDLSFTRASNGTRINSAGLVEVVAWNLLDESERFSNWNLQGTSVSSDSTTAPNGTTTADTIIESNTTDEHNRYLEPNIGGGVFTYSIYLKRFNTDWSALYVFNTAVGGVRHWVNLSTLTAGTSANIGSGIGTTSLSLESVGNGWVRASITFTNPSGSCRFYVANAQSNGGATSYAGNGTNGLYAWGGQINIGSTAKPYFPTTDRLNVPRLTYQNGGGGCPSLLLEKQSTNLALYSQQFDDGAWSKSGVTVTANDTTSPDGTQNAEKIEASGSGSISHSVRSFITTTSGSVYAFSLYAKKGTTDWIMLRHDNGGSFNFFNLNTGTKGTTSQASSTIESVGNGWYRLTVFHTGTGSNGPEIYIATADGTNEFTANGQTLYIWGAQYEASSYPTSYIPTTSSSATRVKDLAYKSGATALIGQTEGVLFCDFNLPSIETSGDYPFIVNIWGNSTNRFGFARYPNGGVHIYMIASTSQFTYNTTQLTGRFKLALGYKANDCVIYLNGTLLQTITSATIPATDDIIFNGINTSGDYNTQLQINQTALFKTRLTNAQLASLTTI